ncbi:carboxymuconolactone decarboxylase family protein [Streptosporangium pseudovulgare]|uniref:Alkyl hydroperoxide reductase AhpD n=1 Tax=Streptosporangium pseudovulgare TaxID=35765 RepID=A0ABQ2RBI9_9ACTN|nr:carboxymuconolactone decarboxylase family protein [Streptosporangium pseudovulgare]GGQ18305.1 alkyl hydroperoxide reductase AhpD [Streptosporangium pseudovulgare]
MGGTLARLMRPGTLIQVRHVSPVRPRAARGLVARVYRQLEDDFGLLAPPVMLHSPSPEALAACWTMLRESLLVAGRTGRAEREAVAAAVSAANACPYCTGVHTETLRGLVPPARAAGTAAHPVPPEITGWARATATRETARRHAAPLPAERTAELAAVAVTFHYLNRMVNVFLDDSPLPPQVPGAARGPLSRLLGMLMLPAARRTAAPGASPGLLPAAPLPDPPDGTAPAGGRPYGGPGDDATTEDGPHGVAAAWTAAVPHFADAFARASAAAGVYGRRSVPHRVRELVAAELAAWDGGPTGLSRAWATVAADRLPAAERPAGRLALLTALASHQVDRAAVEEFRAAGAGDRELVELTSWAALAAARRVASWIPVPPASAPAPAPAGHPVPAARPAAADSG